MLAGADASTGTPAALNASRSRTAVRCDTSRGSRGGWQLDEEWRTRVPGLDDGELRAFLMAQARAMGDAPVAAAAERALDKFLAAMPVALRARAAFLRERLFIDTAGWRGVAVSAACDDDDRVVLRVADDGLGIPPEDRAGTSCTTGARSTGGRHFAVDHWPALRSDVHVELQALFDEAPRSRGENTEVRGGLTRTPAIDHLRQDSMLSR